eukprot:jgi/Botrbrau1/15872/Bobra.40_1s0056.1
MQWLFPVLLFFVLLAGTARSSGISGDQDPPVWVEARCTSPQSAKFSNKAIMTYLETLPRELFMSSSCKKDEDRKLLGMGCVLTVSDETRSRLQHIVGSSHQFQECFINVADTVVHSPTCFTMRLGGKGVAVTYRLKNQAFPDPEKVPFTFGIMVNDLPIQYSCNYTATSHYVMHTAPNPDRDLT